MNTIISDSIPLAITIIIVLISYQGTKFILNRQTKGQPQKGLLKTIVLFSIMVIGIIAIILAIPMEDTFRGQVTSLIGIVIAAVLSLSSATFIGNGLAGIMLRSINNFKPGDFIQVNDIFGRVSERGLFHTEIQTEDRDLTTVPNLTLTNNPVKVTRSSGTVISATCSLGYDVSRLKIEKALLDAAKNAGLVDPFVYILEMGDFSVVYKVHGILENVKTVISQKSKLYGMMLDSLHDAGIEIVSPSFMNQRQVGDQIFIPKKTRSDARLAEELGDEKPEEYIFDKAEEAQTIETVRERIQEINNKIASFEKNIKTESDPNAKEKLKNKVFKLNEVKTKLNNWIDEQLNKIENK